MTALSSPLPSALSETESSSLTTEPSADEQFNRASVYVFEDDRGHIKIGWTKRPEARRERIAVGNPYPVRLAYAREMPMPIARLVERKAHQRFKDSRTTKGTMKEWFLASAADAIEVIDRLADETTLSECSIGAYDRPRDRAEVQVSFRLPAHVAEVYERFARSVCRPLPNFLMVTLSDAATGSSRILNEVREQIERRMK